MVELKVPVVMVVDMQVVMDKVVVEFFLQEVVVISNQQMEHLMMDFKVVSTVQVIMMGVLVVVELVQVIS